jgi:hypothetical protein
MIVLWILGIGFAWIAGWLLTSMLGTWTAGRYDASIDDAELLFAITGLFWPIILPILLVIMIGGEIMGWFLKMRVDVAWFKAVCWLYQRGEARRVKLDNRKKSG